MLEKNNNNALFSAQFIEQTTQLCPLKQVLYHQPNSRHIVCIGEKTQYDWQDLRRFCSQIIARLQNEAPEQQAVALVFKSGFLMVCALLAAVHLKRKVVLPSLSTPEYLQSIGSQFTLLLTDEPKLALTYSKLKNERQQILLLDMDEFNHDVIFNMAKPQVDIDSHPLSKPDILLFTSGSTGQPKSIEKHLVLFDRQIRIEHQLLKSQIKGSVMYSTVNHNHLLGLMYRLLFPLILRMPFFEYSLLIPEQLTKISSAYSLISSPAFLRFLDEKLTYPQANIIFSSGGKLPEKIGLNAKQLLQSELMEFYGSSETSAVAYRTFPQQKWFILDGIQFTQNQEDRCLMISSPFLETEEWYKMEDRINIQANSFELLGRADRIAKISDKRISLTQIENLALQLDEISEVKALVVSDHHRDSIGLVIVLSEFYQDKTRKEILLLLRNHLKNYIELIALPRKVRLVPFMPMNEQGKLSLTLLGALFND